MRSSPSRTKCSCGSTEMDTYRSPGRPPWAPAPPSPVRRRRCPSAMPAGTSTVTVRGSRTVTVAAPAGIADGQRLRLTGEGGAGVQGGRSGDLYVSISVEPHEHFVRDGDDLIYRLDVTMVEAALGATAYVPAFDGDIEVELRPGTQPGEAKIYRNRGVPALQGYGRGDLKVVVNVQVPRHLHV